MKRNFKKVFALVLTLCMILPQTVLAASYSITLEIRDTRNSAKVVTGSSGSYGSETSLLAAEVVSIINAKYDDLEDAFSGSGFRSIVDDGLDAFNNDTEWTNYVNKYYDAVTDKNTQSLKAVLKDKTSTFGDLTAGVKYVMTYENNYEVTLTLNRHGSSGGSSSEETTATMTVPVQGETGNETKIEASIQGSTAVLTVSESQLQTLLDKEETDDTATKDTFATIELSALPETVEGVSIPKQTMEMVHQAAVEPSNKTAGMQVNLPNGIQVSFDAQALQATIDQTAGDQVLLVVETVESSEDTLAEAQKETLKEYTDPLVLDAYMTANGVRISDFKSGTVKTKVPYDWDGQGVLHTVYLDEDGTATTVPSVYEDNFVVMTLQHFSNYVIYTTSECDGGVGCPSEPFTDADTGAWYHDGMDFVVARGWMKGVSNTLFAPNRPTTRGMIVTILYRAEGSPAYTYADTFSDVADGQYYAEAVAWGVANGVIKGYGNGNYGPDDLVTREQIAAILHRYSDYKGYDAIAVSASLDGFRDADAVSGYAVPSLQWAVGEGLVQGDDRGYLLPREPATRAQVATMLMRYFSRNDK